MIFFTADREAGNIIECFDTLEDAMKAIKSYEEEDKRNGDYTPDFYVVVDENNCSVNMPEISTIENDLNDIQTRIAKLSKDFTKVDSIFKKIEAADVFAKNRKLSKKEHSCLISYIIEPHLYELNQYFGYYKESLVLFEKIFQNYDNYKCDSIALWISVVAMIDDYIVRYNEILATFEAL